MKELPLVSVARLVKRYMKIRFSVQVVYGETAHSGIGWKDTDKKATCAADSSRYQDHSVKEAYSLLDGIQYLEAKLFAAALY